MQSVCRLLLLPTIPMVMRQLVTMITVNKSRPTLTVAIAKIALSRTAAASNALPAPPAICVARYLPPNLSWRIFQPLDPLHFLIP